ncbi:MULTISPECIES: hypothetical protein [Brucella]|uniref:hypothetical protein n=1 Tax=Brucella TaxID=234 RepID=UPI0012ED6DF9|nr:MULTISPECIES: hypothetical protein [Brucella]
MKRFPATVVVTVTLYPPSIARTTCMPVSRIADSGSQSDRARYIPVAAFRNLLPGTAWG